jgi:hypothetical protein
MSWIIHILLSEHLRILAVVCFVLFCGGIGRKKWVRTGENRMRI